jgi:hypothetical protein
MEKLNCEQAKRIDLVEYLAFLGHQPQKDQKRRLLVFIAISGGKNGIL